MREFINNKMTIIKDKGGNVIGQGVKIDMLWWFAYTKDHNNFQQIRFGGGQIRNLQGMVRSPDGSVPSACLELVFLLSTDTTEPTISIWKSVKTLGLQWSQVQFDMSIRRFLDGRPNQPVNLP